MTKAVVVVVPHDRYIRIRLLVVSPFLCVRGIKGGTACFLQKCKMGGCKIIHSWGYGGGGEEAINFTQEGQHSLAIAEACLGTVRGI
jgi:hypothetical protein